MDDVMHEQKFPGIKGKSSLLLNFIHLPQLSYMNLVSQVLLCHLWYESNQKMKQSHVTKATGMDKGGYKTFFLIEVNLALLTLVPAYNRQVEIMVGAIS